MCYTIAIVICYVRVLILISNGGSRLFLWFKVYVLVRGLMVFFLSSLLLWVSWIFFEYDLVC